MTNSTNDTSSDTILLINAMGNDNSSSSNTSSLIKPTKWVTTNNCLCGTAEMCTRPISYKKPPVCVHPDIGTNWPEYIRQPPQQHSQHGLQFGLIILLLLVIIALLVVALWKARGRTSRRRRRQQQQQQDPNEAAMARMVEMVVMRHPHVRVRGGIEERPLVVTCKLCRRENAMDAPEDAAASPSTSAMPAHIGVPLQAAAALTEGKELKIRDDREADSQGHE